MNENSTPWNGMATANAERSKIHPIGETIRSLAKKQKETLTDIEGLTNAILTEVLSGATTAVDERSGRPVDGLAGALEDLRDQAKRVQEKLYTLREKLG